MLIRKIRIKKAYIEECVKIEEEQHNSDDLLAEAYNHWGYIDYFAWALLRQGLAMLEA